MAAILDLVNKSRTYVAEMYFIGFAYPANISLGTKGIFLAGLEIEVSQKNRFGVWTRWADMYTVSCSSINNL